MNEEFARFERLMEQATTAISDLYFQLPVAERADAVYRERLSDYGYVKDRA